MTLSGEVESIRRQATDLAAGLSRLESRPSRGVRWEYVFWADLDSDPETPDCAAALAALLREAVMVRVAGVYHRAAEE